MAETPQQLPRTLWLGMGLLLGFLGLAYLLSLVEVKRVHQMALPVFGVVTNFTLTNQDGKTTTLADLSNHVWVADIFFTRCAGPCPRMTAQMKSLQDLLPQNGNAKFVTLTTDPDFDTPEILKKYGERFNADFNRWTFLTGTKSEIGKSRRKQFEIGRGAGETRRPEKSGGSVHPHHDFRRRGPTRATAWHL